MAIKAWGLGLAAVMGISPGLLAQGTEPGRVWTHNTVNGSSFAKQASVGDRGGQVFTLLPGLGGKARLISGASVQGGGTIWEAPLGYELYYGKVDSAENAAVHAAVTVERASSTATPRIMFRAFGSNSTPTVQQVLLAQSGTGTHCGVHVNTNGTRAVGWWYDAAGMKVKVFDFDLLSNSLRANFDLPCINPPQQTAINYTGSDLFVTAGGVDTALQLDSGQILFNYVVNGGTGATNSLARANSDVYAGVRVFGSYNSLQVYKRHNLPGIPSTHSMWFSENYPADLLGVTCAVSPDGKSLAVALASAQNAGALGVDIYDLTQSTHPRIARIQPFSSSPSGTYITSMVYLDEATLACAAISTVGNPEVFAFKQVQGSWSLSYQAESDVTPWALDAGSDGRISTAAYGVSEQTGELIARASLFDLSTNSVELRSIPHASSYADLRLYASPGSRAQLLESTYLASNPITFTGIGTLYLGSSGLIRIPVGLVPASGYVDLELPLSNLVGQTRYLQSFATNPRQLGSSALQVTTVP